MLNIFKLLSKNEVKNVIAPYIQINNGSDPTTRNRIVFDTFSEIQLLVTQHLY